MGGDGCLCALNSISQISCCATIRKTVTNQAIWKDARYFVSEQSWPTTKRWDLTSHVRVCSTVQRLGCRNTARR
jgi:hypothetical protein